MATKQSALVSANVSQNYVDTLGETERNRYIGKIAAVKGTDPYQVEPTSWTTDAKNLPTLHNEDIVDYLVHRTSFYTMKAFKARKQLAAHNLATSGWVKSVRSFKPDRSCDNTIISGEVCHSQSINDKVLLPWVIVENDGTVLTGHCTCMAGLGETCSHVAALLFAISATVRLRDSIAPTQVPAYWVVPTTKPVLYEKAANIDFTSAENKKRQLDSAIDGAVCQKKGKRKSCVVNDFKQEELQALYDSIQFAKTGMKPAVLSLIPEYSDTYVPAERPTELPLCLSNLFNEDLVTKPYHDVVDFCKGLDITVTKEQAVMAEQQTRNQSKSKLWMSLRAGRVTASNAHAAGNTNPAQPSMSMLRSVCRPSNSITTAAMRWGRDHEKKAIEAFQQKMKAHHSDLRVESCGLFISPEQPFLGASPDAMIFCSCHGRACLEVKCPFGKATINPKTCDFLQELNGEISLKPSHKYYTQVQLQMYVTETECCYFAVWTETETLIVKLYPDRDFCMRTVAKIEHVFTVAILPEIVGQVFSRPLQPDVNSSSAASDLYCYCRRKEDEDDMVQCDNKKCTVQWFHFFCVGIRSAPKGRWYCPTCRQLPEFQKMGKVQPKLKG